MMANLIAVHSWLGRRGEPLSPESMQFTTSPAMSCRGCLFDGQASAVCDRACRAAQRAELEHCEQGYIYVAKAIDPRQANLLDKEH